MRKVIFGLAALAALSGCVPALATVGGIASGGPRLAAERTVIDEQAAMGAELAYASATMLGRPLAMVGLIDRERFKALDNAAFAALGRVRAAYDAGNAASFKAGFAELKAAVKDINALAGENGQ